MRYSRTEIELIIKRYPTEGTKFLAKELKRPEYAIRSKAKELGIKYCGHTSRFKDLSNQTFGYLQVKQLSHIDKHAYWICNCKCGNKVVTIGSRLINKTTQSCGCYNREQTKKLNYKGGQYITGREFGRIKQLGKKRTRILEFNVDLSFLENLYEKQNKKCALSGVDIYFDSTTPNSKNGYLGNASVDRIDSSKGYTADNIQLVDKYVNIAKQAMPQNEFISMCKRIAGHNQ